MIALEGTVSMRPEFQILALDGGGARALFSAHVLARLEEDISVDIVKNFDLIAGTSAGGIIALALGAGIRPKEIVQKYAHLIDRVFPRPRKFSRVVRGTFGPMYSAGRLRSALEEVFGRTLIGDSRVKLVVTSWDAESGVPQVYKTPHHSKVRRDGRLSMVDVAMATSAAPAYFSAARVDSQSMLDGGVWANNPSVVGIAEAVGSLGVPLSNVRLLNIGTTESVVSHPRRLERGGWTAWAPHAAGLVVRAGSRGGQGIARNLLGPDRYVRFDAKVPDGVFKLDEVGKARIDAVATLASRHLSPVYAERFLGHMGSQFRPNEDEQSSSAV